MVLLQMQVQDSVAQVADTLSNMYGLSVVDSMIWDSIVIPVALLVLVSLIKYTIGVDVKGIKWIDFFAEMSVDLLTVFGAFIIGRYFVLASSSFTLLLSIGKVLIIVCAIFFNSLLRRSMSQLIMQSKLSYFKIGYKLFLEYLIAICCLALIF